MQFPPGYTVEIPRVHYSDTGYGAGVLGQQVIVRSRDEIGELACSFNRMSADLAHASYLRKQMTADLAHDLRVLSLADAGELSLNRRSVDPAALLERTGLAYIMQAEQQGITLQVEATKSLPSISVDTDRMTQVLNNLVSNALRYTHKGVITLSAIADSAYVRINMTDTGSGIAAEDLPFVFERFYRADKSRQRSRFIITLPVAQPADAELTLDRHSTAAHQIVP